MQPFSAHRRAGRIVLELNEDAFLDFATRGAADHLRIADRETFLRFALDNIFTLTHDVRDEKPATWWQRLCESLAHAAVETKQGVNEHHRVAPTCGCDPEEHDGG